MEALWLISRVDGRQLSHCSRERAGNPFGKEALGSALTCRQMSAAATSKNHSYLW